MESNVVIGRNQETKDLWRCYNSTRSEFVILYGRRRIGKTYLVYQTFKDKLSFYFTGSHKSPETRQLQVFANQLKKYGHLDYTPAISNWYDAFDMLQQMLESQPQESRKLIFIDEMPWIDTYRSDFVAALEDFWNMWAAQRSDICMIACGSSTSWMVNKLVKNQGGLHNRITSTIYLRPFNLNETEEYLRHINCTWDRYTILQCYMCFGGVPFYLSLLEPSESLAQNIDILFFKKGAKLKDEFNELYDVLFNMSENYKNIVRALSMRREGLTRDELIKQTNIEGGTLTNALYNLENSDFIISFKQFGMKKKGTIYRLTDFFTFFYFKFIENNNSKDPHFWEKNCNSPTVLSWQGFTFELICLTHLEQIKQAIGVSGISTEASSWRSNDKNLPEEIRQGQKEKTQIDLLISRADRIINICEIKFSTAEYSISKEYEAKMRRKLSIFQSQTGTKNGLVMTFITTYGVLPNIHSGIVQKQVTMDDLFRKEEL